MNFSGVMEYNRELQVCNSTLQNVKDTMYKAARSKMMKNTEIINLYKGKAEAVACKIVEYKTMEEAIPYILRLVEEKTPCELLDEEDVEKGPLGPNGAPTRVTPVIAAPDLDADLYKKFSEACEAKGYICISKGLRKYLAGIDLGIANAILGVAETGTCMVNTSNEDLRLATMICEISVLILRKSTIKPTLISVADDLRKHIDSSQTSYTTFISGPSRTADIERVGAIGVHGSLEMHIILLED